MLAPAVHVVVYRAAGDDRAGVGEEFLDHPPLAAGAQDIAGGAERLLCIGVLAGDEPVKGHRQGDLHYAHGASC